MNPTLRKWIVKPLLIIIISATVLAAVGFIILSTQQQRLVNMAVRKLNEQYRGELVIEESSISLFQNFPYVSLVLHNGRFFSDKTKQGKPIYEFDQLYAGFSASDLMNEKYDVKALFIQGGYLDVVREANGAINLLEAETQVADPKQQAPASDTSAALTVDLEKIILKDMNVSFFDKATEERYTTSIETLLSSLRMDSSRVAVIVEGDMALDVVTKTDSTFFRDKKFRLDLLADYHLHSKLFELSMCKLKLEDAQFSVTGFANVTDTMQVSFRVKGDEQNFNLVTAFLPEHVKEKLKPFQYNGHLEFDALISGKVTEDKLPHIQVTFGCEDAWFLNTSAGKKIDQLGFKGFYTNGSEQSLKTSEVHIINVSARPEKGIFKGHFIVRDFTSPKAVVRLNSELELKFVGEFLGIPDLKQITGNIKLDMDFKELHDISLPEESLNRLKEGIQSKLTVENLSFRIPGYPHAVRNMNVVAEMKDGRVTVDSAALRIGKSDFEMSGSISDVRAFLRGRNKTINLVLNAGSRQVSLADLLSYDTALARKWNEEIQGFNIALKFETTPQELLNPSPLPRGIFEMKNLRGTFKEYAHTFKNLGCKVEINDTLLRLRDFVGMIDSTDINFKGRITNYHLWFDNIKKGKTQIAFDFKSNRFGMKDVLGKTSRQYIPRGYRREELKDVWLRAKIDLSYDTNFRFAKGKISNVTAHLKKHGLNLDSISGGFKYGSKILAFDTLRGKIGNSDFDVSMKYYFKGVDRYNNPVANSLTFSSKLLDIDQMSEYDLAPKTGRSKRDTTKVAEVQPEVVKHAEAFNIFMIPFSDFNAQIKIGKVKYNKLWLKDVNANLTMKQDQTITIDTLMLKVARGSVRARGKFNGKDHQKIYFRSRIVFDTVDIEKLMLKFDHFGQDLVVNKNVKGRLSGNIRSYVQVHPNLVPIMANTKAEMNLKISNGTLVDFAPMQAVASYFKDKNLRLIRFDTLENKLTLTNGVLEIPAMSINSSIGYIQMSGKQSLDLSMEYYLRVPLKMVSRVGWSSLFNRKPEEVDTTQIDEIEMVDKQKKIAFMNLKVTGTPDNFKVGLGKDKGKKLL